MNLKPNEIEKMLTEIAELKDKLEDAKVILKQYKIKSPALDDLKKAKKELNEQIADEKDRIENEYYEDKDYETARNDELTYKNQLREKNAHLRQLMSQVDTDKQLSTYDYNIKGEKVKMQVERVVKVYINGKEEK
jgi:DNA repair exonuclease SbcCD ATPase subunit